MDEEKDWREFWNRDKKKSKRFSYKCLICMLIIFIIAFIKREFIKEKLVDLKHYITYATNDGSLTYTDYCYVNNIKIILADLEKYQEYINDNVTQSKIINKNFTYYDELIDSIDIALTTNTNELKNLKTDTVGNLILVQNYLNKNEIRMSEYQGVFIAASNYSSNFMDVFEKELIKYDKKHHKYDDTITYYYGARPY